MVLKQKNWPIRWFRECIARAWPEVCRWPLTARTRPALGRHTHVLMATPTVLTDKKRTCPQWNRERRRTPGTLTTAPIIHEWTVFIPELTTLVTTLRIGDGESEEYCDKTLYFKSCLSRLFDTLNCFRGVYHWCCCRCCSTADELLRNVNWSTARDANVRSRIRGLYVSEQYFVKKRHLSI